MTGSVVFHWICVLRWFFHAFYHGIQYQLGKIFFANRSSQVEIVFVILWPGGFGTFMRDAKRPASLPRNYHSWFQWSVPVGGFWKNCSLLTAKHCMTFHCQRAYKEHSNSCFCCWWAKFNTGWLLVSSKFRWWNDHLVGVEHELIFDSTPFNSKWS